MCQLTFLAHLFSLIHRRDSLFLPIFFRVEFFLGVSTNILGALISDFMAKKDFETQMNVKGGFRKPHYLKDGDKLRL